ncbi:MAG TPA: zinc ribbon domain-containing protein [Candidatus Binatia bacterium]|jgi:putative FmdB family regulatory protein
MPIYEYECGKCGTFEATQRITDKPLTRCPTCRGKVKKLISNTSFQLKGTGWYITDYARKDKGTADKKGAKGEKASTADSKDGSGKADSSDAKEKPAAEKSTTKTASSESTTS